MPEPRLPAVVAGASPDPATAASGGADRAAGEGPPLTVLYDGACPLCRREIAVYRGLRPNTPLCFADVSDDALALPPGSTRAQLLARFHVRGRDGELLGGAQAFLALWAALPGWRGLAWTVRRVPGAVRAMEHAYRLFLRWRPALQRLASRLDRPRPGRPGAGGDAPRRARRLGMPSRHRDPGRPAPARFARGTGQRRNDIQAFRMSENPLYCGSATCILDAEGRCWCGQQWDAEGRAVPDAAGPPQATAPESRHTGTDADR